MAKANDYEALRREYINSNMSIRELCRRNGIKAYSTVAEYAKTHGWYDKRAAVQASTEEKVIQRVSDRLADSEVDELVKYRSLALQVIQGALYKFANDLAKPESTITPSDLIRLVNQGLLLLGQPTSRTEERHLELTGSLDGLPPEFLRRLADVTRAGEAQLRTVEGVAQPSRPSTRAN